MDVNIGEGDGAKPPNTFTEQRGLSAKARIEGLDILVISHTGQNQYSVVNYVTKCKYSYINVVGCHLKTT